MRVPVAKICVQPARLFIMTGDLSMLPALVRKKGGRTPFGPPRIIAVTTAALLSAQYPMKVPPVSLSYQRSASRHISSHTALESHTNRIPIRARAGVHPPFKWVAVVQHHRAGTECG